MLLHWFHTISLWDDESCGIVLSVVSNNDRKTNGSCPTSAGRRMAASWHCKKQLGRARKRQGQKCSYHKLLEENLPFPETAERQIAVYRNGRKKHWSFWKRQNNEFVPAQISSDQLRSVQMISDHRRPVQIRSDQGILHQITSHQLRSAHISSDQLRPAQISSGQFRGDRISSGQCRWDQRGSGQIMSDQGISGALSSEQFRSGQISSAQFRSVQSSSDQLRAAPINSTHGKWVVVSTNDA